MSEPVKQNSEFRISNPGPALTKTQEHFMRLLEQENRERVAALLRFKKKSKLIGVALAGTVIGIYSYTILAIGQEKFLDDFDEPKKVIDVKK